MTREEAIEVYNGLINTKIKEAFEFFVPELRESEDAMMEKAIVDALLSHCNSINLLSERGYQIEDVKAWLEKQKEQKPNYCHYGGDPNIERCRCCSAACSGRLADEQKPPIAGNDFGWIDELKHDLEHPEELDQKVDDVLKQRKGMSLEWCEVELEFRGEMVKVKRPFYRDDKGRGYSTTEQDEIVAWNALRAWCEKKGVSLYDLYPNTEWSEEDERMLTDISWAIRHCAYDDKKKERVMKWFNDDYRKFLRPSWKPSEEQMEALESAVKLYKDTHFEIHHKKIVSLYEQLKKLM